MRRGLTIHSSRRRFAARLNSGVRALTSIASAAATQLNLSCSAGNRKELSFGRARVVSRGCTALEISRGSAAALSGSLCFRAALAGCGGLPAPRLLAAPG